MRNLRNGTVISLDSSQEIQLPVDSQPLRMLAHEMASPQVCGTT